MRGHSVVTCGQVVVVAGSGQRVGDPVQDVTFDSQIVGWAGHCVGLVGHDVRTGVSGQTVVPSLVGQAVYSVGQCVCDTGQAVVDVGQPVANVGHAVKVLAGHAVIRVGQCVNTARIGHAVAIWVHCVIVAGQVVVLTGHWVGWTRQAVGIPGVMVGPQSGVCGQLVGTTICGH